MILYTGDVHGDGGRFSPEGTPGEEKLGKGDYLAVAGDAGLVFWNEDLPRYAEGEALLDALEKKPYTILFVDGNHENHRRLGEYPVEEWCGGRVHRIRKNILHLMRGEIFEIDGVTLFAMGGAYSVDRYLRREGVSFWREEVPSGEELKRAGQNLVRHGLKVDVVLTHTAPTSIIQLMGYVPNEHDRELTGFLDWVFYDVKFEKWYFGHWHRHETFPRGARCLYFDSAE